MLVAGLVHVVRFRRYVTVDLVDNSGLFLDADNFGSLAPFKYKLKRFLYYTVIIKYRFTTNI